MKTRLEENSDNRIIDANNFLNGNNGGNGRGRRNKKRLPIERPCYRCQKIIKLFFYPLKTNHIYCAVCEQNMNKEYARRRMEKIGGKKRCFLMISGEGNNNNNNSNNKFKKIMFVRNLK